MKLQTELAALHDDMKSWRHALHAHPELGFQEHWTADFVAAKLESFGLKVSRGLATTGVVGTLTAGGGGNAIGLRADMDALPMREENEFDYRSRNPDCMHGCGHDGHTTMLLGAARYLAEQPRFDGTVHFIFQPAEEGGGGGDVMVKEGLFEKFPVKGVYGMHNWPGVPIGSFGVKSGPIMASSDTFELQVSGQGCHAAMPDLGRDPVVAAAQIVTGLQTIVSRSVAPTEPVVVSVTQIHGGSAWNVIPEKVVIRGSVRTLSSQAREAVEPAIRRIAEGVCASFGTRFDLSYKRGFPVTVNHHDETEFAAAVAADLVGKENILRNLEPSMGSEDFAYMLQAMPGSYVWIGNGPADNGRMLHSPHYDFNDEILPLGAAYWASLVRTALPLRD